MICDCFREGERMPRRGVRPLWQKPDGNSRCPDRFRKSQTAIHNGRTALAKVVPQLEKSDGHLEIPAGNSQSQNRTLDFRLTFAKVVRLLQFPANFAKILTARLASN